MGKGVSKLGFPLLTVGEILARCNAEKRALGHFEE